MPKKHDIFRAAGAAAHMSGLSALASIRYGGAGTIFMLHSIVAKDDYLPRENTQNSIDFLDAMLRHYRHHKIPIVTLTEAMDRLAKPGGKRFVCFTFDDGYRDNLTRALPVFRKYDAPFTVYITGSFLNRSYPDYWWGQLRYLIKENDRLSGDYVGKAMSLATPADKISAYKRLSSAMSADRIGEDQRNAIFERYNLPLAEVLDRDAMTAAELKAAAIHEPLLEIGGHTKNHARLAELDEAAAYQDICQNKADLESLLDRQVKHFCYPFGDARSCGPREFELARRAGYSTATTTRFGNLFAEHSDNSLALPRMRFLGPCESIGFMETQRSGAIVALTSRFGNPVATV